MFQFSDLQSKDIQTCLEDCEYAFTCKNGSLHRHSFFLSQVPVAQ